MEQDDVAVLVARARSGEREAWAAIWDAHGPALHRYASRLLGDDHDAGDAVADTFVSAAEHLADLREPDRLRPWLYAICRRHVQRRWQARDRVRPFEADLLTTVVDARQVDVSPAGSLDAAEAAELLWAAAEGMGPADRELLGLVLGSDLDSGDVAAITGEAPSAVYVRVSRLKDALGRSAGALLVARHHREDCEALDQLLSAWDGVYAPLWRKRIARHVDACEVCGSSRTAAAGGLFSLAGLAPLMAVPLALRDRAVEGATRASAGDLALVSSRSGLDEAASLVLAADGFPVPRAWPTAPVRRRRRGLVAVAAAVALLVVGAGSVVALGGENDGAAPVAAQATAPPVLPASTSSPLPPTSSPAPAVTPPPRTTGPTTTPTTAPTAPRPAPPTSGGPVLATTAPPPVRTAAPTSAAPSTLPPVTAAPVPAAPAVVLAPLSPAALTTACGSPTTTTARATSSGGAGPLVTRISWDGTAPGSESFPGAGTHSAVVGPYSSTVATTDTVTVTAVVTDALGRTAAARRTLTVSVVPC